MKFINKDTEPLFDADGNFVTGQKVGFNFDNAPDIYAVFTILSIEGDVAVLSEPVRVIKEDTTAYLSTEKG